MGRVRVSGTRRVAAFWSLVPLSASRLDNLRATLAFLRLPPTGPELVLLHRWLDSWAGFGLIAVGVERLGYRLPDDSGDHLRPPNPI